MIIGCSITQLWQRIDNFLTAPFLPPLHPPLPNPPTLKEIKHKKLQINADNIELIESLFSKALLQ